MKLLIDECLSPKLAKMAQELGYEASHVVWLGMSGYKDWSLIPVILKDDWTFVTRNSVDFRGPMMEKLKCCGGLYRRPPWNRPALFHRNTTKHAQRPQTILCRRRQRNQLRVAISYLETWFIL